MEQKSKYFLFVVSMKFLVSSKVSQENQTTMHTAHHVAVILLGRVALHFQL
jgi:hypothetical protein